MEEKAYCVYHENKNILRSSSSGGVFFAIADHYIRILKGVVYGVASAGKEVFFGRAEAMDDF